jgi:hypothetical protein
MEKSKNILGIRAWYVGEINIFPILRNVKFTGEVVITGILIIQKKQSHSD